jgi:hypothetical protein
MNSSGLTAAISSLALQSVSAAALPAGMVVADLTALIGASNGLELSNAVAAVSATAEPTSAPDSDSLPLPAIAGAAGAVAAVVLVLLLLLWVARKRAAASRAATLRALRRSIQRIKGAEALLLRAQTGAPVDSAGVLDSLSLGLATDALLPSGSTVPAGKGGAESAVAQQRVAQMLPSVVDSLLGGPEAPSIPSSGAPAAAAQDPENGSDAAPAGGAVGTSAEQKQRQQAVRQFAGRMQRGVVADMVQTALATVAQTLADPVMLRDAVIAAIAAEEVKEAAAAAAAAAHSAQTAGDDDSGIWSPFGVGSAGMSSNHLRQRRSIHAFVPQQARKPVNGAPALSSQDAVLRALMAAATGRIQDELAPPQAAGKAGEQAGSGTAVSESDMWALEELEEELLLQEQQKQARAQAMPAAGRYAVAGHTGSAPAELDGSDGDGADDDPSALAALSVSAAAPSLPHSAATGTYSRPPQTLKCSSVHPLRPVPAPAPAVPASECTPALLPAAMRFVVCAPAPAPAAPALGPIAVKVAPPSHSSSSRAAGRQGGPVLSTAARAGAPRLSVTASAGEYVMPPSARAHIVSRAAQSRLAAAVPALAPAHGAGPIASAPAPAEWRTSDTRRTSAGGTVTTSASAAPPPPPGEQSRAGGAPDGGAAVEPTPTLRSFHQLLAAVDARRDGGRAA